MLTLKEHIELVEAKGKKPRGAEFENIICAAYNMKSIGNHFMMIGWKLVTRL
jgi:hypothetical protein